MDPKASTTTSQRPLALKLAIGAAVAITLLLALVLIVKPFSGGDVANAASDDEYAVTFDGESYSGGGATAVPKTKPVVQRDSEEKYASAESAEEVSKHRLAELPVASTTTAPAEGAQTSAELKKALKEQHLDARNAKGDKVELAPDGSALAPVGAPGEINSVIAAGNVIKNFPYIWGGGHGSFQARGYDCSGSVSYALKAASLVDKTMTSGEYENWGEPGPGKWITVYANGGHVFMIVGGLRFDTSFRDGPRGTRWQTAKRNMNGFVVRHPAGL